MDLNFDRKRVWLDSWKNGREVQTKRIKSLALYLDNPGVNGLYSEVEGKDA